jgi:beta-galactosidase
VKTTLLPAIGILGALLFGTGTGIATMRPPRRTLSFDGAWQTAEGTMGQVPALIECMAPALGLVSLAMPPFADPPGPKVADRSKVPQPDPKRDAFWYRRVFQIDQPLPIIAVLKVHKAMFGSQVILNGKALGDHRPNFTPGYFNARPVLKVGENVLLIRIGAEGGWQRRGRPLREAR